MLAADKLQLQSSLKQQATALKEKEFNLHHSNLMTVGTQAAVLAGLDITMFVEFNPPPNSEWNPELIGRALKFFYYLTITSAFCANMLVVANTTILSVLGAGMALRGPDGSMMTATDGLYEERTSVFGAFGVGLACTLIATVLCVWIILHWEAALMCMFITLYTCRKVYVNYRRVCKRFGFDESETVDFRDIFDGPANIRYYARRKKIEKQQQQQKNNHHQSSSSRNHQRHHHHSKKHTPQRNNIKDKTTWRQHYFNYSNETHSLPYPPGDRPSSPSEDDDEMNAFIPNSNSDSRLHNRRGGGGSSHDSYGDYDGTSDGSSAGTGEYEMRIQTV